MTTISPFAPEKFPDLLPVAGFEMAVAASGQRYQGRNDLWAVRAAPGTQIAGIFTRNKVPGAPIDWSRAALRLKADPKAPRLIIVNAGNANVFTGDAGLKACRETASQAARHFGGKAERVVLASTGVIGEPLDASRLTACFPDMARQMNANSLKLGRPKPDEWKKAAQAIATTDTFPKGAFAEAEIGGAPVSICGIAKGSGMIAPDMATMLGFIFTDANISEHVLQSLLTGYARLTFNAISVDSDTSTSDMILLSASRKADHRRITDVDDPALGGFKDALLALMKDLAHQIIKDGEGISKFITVRITGAMNDDSARIIAMSIANSPLVKTAIAGEDANWGRIVMAAGKAGQPLEPTLLTVKLGPHILAQKGQLSEAYQEEKGALYMKNPEIDIEVDLGMGTGEFTAWSCDLTHGYISINADYRS